MSIWSELAQEALPGLGRMRRLLAHLGHPEEGLPVIQVAGTHGKTSVIGILESTLGVAGVQVGVVTSLDRPHPWEAARLAGKYLCSERLEPLVSQAVWPWEDFAEVGRPTPQEAVLAGALAYFAALKVELVLLERTVGGPWDPTNCVRPQLSLLTQVLPPANAEWEVRGLAQAGVPLLTTAEDEALLAVAEACQAAGAALSLVGSQDVKLVELGWDRAVWRSHSDPFSLGLFETPFLGAYQAPNLAVSLATLAELMGGFGLSRGAVAEGLRSLSLPCRFELVHRGPWVIVDVCQTGVAAHALRRSLAHLPPLEGRRHLLLSHPSSTLAAEMLEILRPAFSRAEEVLPAQLAEAARRWASRLGEEDLLVIAGVYPALWEVRRVFVPSP